MLKRFAFALALFFVSVCYTISGYAEQNTRVLLVGDSLSAGYGLQYGNNWVDMLQQRLNNGERKIEIINDSISGDTTAAGLARLPRALSKHEPDWLVIELGANDGLRGLSLKAMRNNIENMVELGRQFDARVILIGMDLPKNYGTAFRRAFKQVYDDIADKYELPLLPGERFAKLIGNADLLQKDGLHPNELAQPVIQEIMYDFLKPIIVGES